MYGKKSYFCSMKLHYRKIGAGKPLVVLHGVFGSSDNLYTAAKHIAEKGYEVFILDARNHGQSPRSDEFNYTVMASDLNEFILEQELHEPAIMGHSMGGKTVLQFSQHYDAFSKLIVVDISQRKYSPHHSHIIAGLNAINPSNVGSRGEAEEIFSKYVIDPGERQFLLKNLYRKDEGGFDWRINVPVLSQNMERVIEEIPLTKVVEKPFLLIRGGNSNYVQDNDFSVLKQFYPNCTFDTIEGANHWVHAIQPTLFVESVVQFLDKTR